MLGIWDLISFPNNLCEGTGSIYGKDGVCYLKEECTKLEGTRDGPCASGFGVCCIFILPCGATVKQNLTYLIQDVTTNPGLISCPYTICPISKAVNRIRLDLNKFTIAGPVAHADQTGAAANTLNTGSSVGDCAIDTFVVSSGGGGKSSPVICGTNSNQHIYVDTDGENCITASFVFGGDTLEREYDIRVLQYDTTNQMGGPQGCLQYFLGATEPPHGGIITSFNWQFRFVNDGDPTTAPVLDVQNTIHLSNQNYDICVRRTAGACAICWAAATMGTATLARGSFGLR